MKIESGEGSVRVVDFAECECNSTEHTMKFEFFRDIMEKESEGDFEYAELSASIYLNNDFAPISHPFWTPRWISLIVDKLIVFPIKRAVVAVGYFFGYKCKYGHWDCFLFRPEDVDSLIEMLTLFKITRAEQVAKMEGKREEGDK